MYYGKSKSGLGKGGKARKILAATQGGSYRARTGRKKYFAPGYERISGYYGRYNKTPQSKGELKFFDTVSSATIRSTGQIQTTSLNLIPQGTTESQRIGRKCVIEKISMKGTLNCPSNVLEGDLVQLALVVDTQCNGANAAYTDIWVSATNINSFHNMANSGRFRILKVFRKLVNPNAVVGDSMGALSANIPYVIEFKFNRRCYIPLEFSSTTGAITEIKSNNIAWYAISQHTDNQLSLTMTTRVRYSG